MRELKKIPGLKMHPLPSMALARWKQEKVPEWAQMLVSCRRAHEQTLVNVLKWIAEEPYGNCEWERIEKPQKKAKGEKRKMEGGRRIKAGDLVRILDGRDALNYFGGWASAMLPYVGETKVVEGFVCDGHGIRLKYTPYNWDERYLELVAEAPRPEPDKSEAEAEVTVEKASKEFKIRNGAGVLTVTVERELSLRDVFYGIGNDRLPAMERPRLEVHKDAHRGDMLITLSDRHDAENTMYVVEIPVEYGGSNPMAWLGHYKPEQPEDGYVTMEPWREGRRYF